jgi:hypothetical protein
MRALFIVVSAPILQLRPGVVKCHEPVSVQAFDAEAAIEGFDERVVGGFAGNLWLLRSSADFFNGIDPKRAGNNYLPSASRRDPDAVKPSSPSRLTA